MVGPNRVKEDLSLLLLLLAVCVWPTGVLQALQALSLLKAGGSDQQHFQSAKKSESVTCGRFLKGFTNLPNVTTSWLSLPKAPESSSEAFDRSLEGPEPEYRIGRGHESLQIAVVPVLSTYPRRDILELLVTIHQRPFDLPTGCH